MTPAASDYGISETLTPEQLVDRLQGLLGSPFSGTVTLSDSTGSVLGNVTCQAGKLLWISGGQHRWRRWRRLTQQLAPHWEQPTLRILAPGEHWKYRMVTLGLQQQTLPETTAIALLEHSAIEGLFDILQGAQGGCQWSATSALESTSEVWGSLQGPALFSQAQQRWQAWQAAGLAACSPDAAPKVQNATALQQRTSPQVYQTLTTLLNGQSSLRELAVLMQQDLQMLAQTLLAYTRWELIALETVADLPGPHLPATEVPGSASGPATPSGAIAPGDDDAPLIMCIDDNPKTCEMLGKILTSAGYRFVAVQDSLQALPVLLEKKPDFIFLDLVMPVASGYEVCSQIRRISSFKDTPVVILTGNDGIIDRIRSKTSGSTDFISKPLDVAKVLAAVKRYLPDRVPAAAQVTP